MAEVTRVPLQPVARGSLSKVWIGVVVAIVLAALVAWWAMPAGVDVEEVRAGRGPSPTAEDVVFIKYTGKLDDGTVFDQSQDIPLPVPGILPEGTPMQLGSVVPGFRDAVMKMQRGGKYVAHIPSDKGYGATPPPGAPIPPNADLTFDIELIDFMPLAEAQQRVQMMQAMMQQQMGGQGGAPGAPGAPPPSAPPVE